MRRIFLAIFAAGLAMAFCCCGGKKAEPSYAFDPLTLQQASNPHHSHCGYMPDSGTTKLRIYGVGGNLGRVFNDSNYLHLAEAERIGISPISSTADAWAQADRLERLASCPEYFLDDLTHSHPYLIPEAHALLKDIGRAFADSLQTNGGGAYRLKVTSVLRTFGAIKRLRRRNVNAVDTSAHLFGTTFDISYAKFICDSPQGVVRTQEDLKNKLGEVLRDLRDQGRCYVKYERKQGCFHITARGN